MKDEFAEYSDESSDDMDESAESEETPITEEGAPEEMAESIHIPSGFLQGKAFKAGDKVVLTVVSTDDEGVEVAMSEAMPESEEGPSANEEIDAMAGERY